jgi:hypothetical protein
MRSVSSSSSSLCNAQRMARSAWREHSIVVGAMLSIPRRPTLPGWHTGQFQMAKRLVHRVGEFERPVRRSALCTPISRVLLPFGLGVVGLGVYHRSSVGSMYILGRMGSLCELELTHCALGRTRRATAPPGISHSKQNRASHSHSSPKRKPIRLQHTKTSTNICSHTKSFFRIIHPCCPSIRPSPPSYRFISLG